MKVTTPIQGENVISVELDNTVNTLVNFLFDENGVNKSEDDRDFEKTLTGQLSQFPVTEYVKATLHVVELEDRFNVTCWSVFDKSVEQVFRTFPKGAHLEAELISFSSEISQKLTVPVTNEGKRVFSDILKKPMDILSSILFVEGSETRKSQATNQGKLVTVTSVGRLVTDPDVTILIKVTENNGKVTVTVTSMNEKPEFNVYTQQWLRQENWIMFGKQALEHIG